ncbi:MAG: hypothetical protein AMXMBFR64_61550 [Myxococcales bacterium]
MQLQTASFGVIDVDPAALIEFPSGLPGFEHCRRFKLLHEESEAPVVHFLQCIDDPEVTFSVADPAALGFTYDIVLTDEEQAALQVERAEDLALLVILLRRMVEGEHIPLHELPITASVTSPLVIDTRSLRGLQKVLLGIEYSVHVRARG